MSASPTSRISEPATSPSVYRPLDEAPATAARRPLSRPDIESLDLSVDLVEFVSRGDFASATFLSSESAGRGPRPLVLWVRGSADAKGSLPAFPPADWAQGDSGWAIADLDLPLHGRRASPKLSERLFQGLEAHAEQERPSPTRDADPDLDTLALVEEFVRQSVSDIVRAIEALSGLAEVDSSRVALVGDGIGASVVIHALRHITGPAPRVVVLGPQAVLLAPPRQELDPRTHWTGPPNDEPVHLLCRSHPDFVGGSAIHGVASEPKTLLPAGADASADLEATRAFIASRFS